jgi:hypothetical protein
MGKIKAKKQSNKKTISTSPTKNDVSPIRKPISVLPATPMKDRQIELNKIQASNKKEVEATRQKLRDAIQRREANK